jgi:acetyl-CoA acetyltransferase
MVGMQRFLPWNASVLKNGDTPEDLAAVKVILSEYGSASYGTLQKPTRWRKSQPHDGLRSAPLRYALPATARRPHSLGRSQVIAKADKPVKVLATTMGSSIYGDPHPHLGLSAPAKAEAPMLSESYSASRQAYERAGVGPEDVDVLELPDNSSWHYLQYLETCGFCGEGEAHKMLREGQTKIGGKVAVNPSGGFSSFGEAIGAQAIWQVVQVASQLRGRCGGRRVPNCKIGMAQTYGLMGNSGTTIMKI